MTEHPPHKHNNVRVDDVVIDGDRGCGPDLTSSHPSWQSLKSTSDEHGHSGFIPVATQIECGMRRGPHAYQLMRGRGFAPGKNTAFEDRVSDVHPIDFCGTLRKSGAREKEEKTSSG